MFGTTMPPVMEFSWRRTIEDRALAPVPIRVLAIQKITAGAIQAFPGAVIVFPIVLLVHSPGQAPHAHVTNWFLFALIMVASPAMTASLGLLLGGQGQPPSGHPPPSCRIYRDRYAKVKLVLKV
jgi:hypothetical protein